MENKTKVIFILCTARSYSTIISRYFLNIPNFILFNEPYADCSSFGPDRIDRYRHLSITMPEETKINVLNRTIERRKINLKIKYYL